MLGAHWDYCEYSEEHFRYSLISNPTEIDVILPGNDSVTHISQEGQTTVMLISSLFILKGSIKG